MGLVHMVALEDLVLVLLGEDGTDGVRVHSAAAHNTGPGYSYLAGWLVGCLAAVELVQLLDMAQRYLLMNREMMITSP